MLDLAACALWFILPAYVANSSPVVLGGGRPIDGGRNFIDGKPLFGPGKTIRGFVGGVAAGTVTGIVLALLHPLVFRDSEPIPGLKSLTSYVRLSFLLSLGALTGDLLGSFIKRRLGMKRGDPAFLMDQLGFLLMALLFVYPFFEISLKILLFLLLVTPPLHLGTNFLAYKLKLKNRPY